MQAAISTIWQQIINFSLMSQLSVRQELKPATNEPKVFPSFILLNFSKVTVYHEKCRDSTQSTKEQELSLLETRGGGGGGIVTQMKWHNIYKSST